MIACTEQYAKSENDPKEMIAGALINAPSALTPAQRNNPLSYTISGLEEAAQSAVVATDEQTVRFEDERLFITVSKQRMPGGVERPYNGDLSNALGASEWIQSDAPEIEMLSEKAVNGAVDARTAARNIEHFVADYIEEKSFSVGYASALEVLHSRQGDCTEHALLTAALCRAAGIPADVIFGLVYVPEFENQKHLFGGHAWTRVYLDGKWYSLDAALGGFDTGHIALTVSDGDPTDFFKIMDVVGSFHIESVD
jgi:transglutaminase-like putative cysteine protease